MTDLSDDDEWYGEGVEVAYARQLERLPTP